MMRNRKILLLSAFFLFATAGITVGQTFKAWMNAADESMTNMRYAEAIEYYKKALEFETGDITLEFKMAEACRMYNDYDRAAIHYGKTLSDDKENRYPMALFYFAEMKKYLGMYEESARLYERYASASSTDSGYFKTKALHESASLNEVVALAGKNTDVQITNAGTPVNTIYSDFAASISGDTTLYYSSLKYKYESKEKKSDPYYVSRILNSRKTGNKFGTPVPMSILFNEASTHNCNVTFSPDFKLMVFTRCAGSGEQQYDCSLYFSSRTQGNWSKPELIPGNINLAGYTATQPAVEARGADGYTLYFISDRPGGQGKLDIWKSDINAALQFSEPVNIGAPVNTFDDEMTPYFDTPNSTLYFSSYGHTNLGGMDIYKSVKNSNGQYLTPENLGPGYNTSVNDVYFTVRNNGRAGTFSSNRNGSMYVGSKTCCYDIYLFEVPETKKDTAVTDSSLISNGGPKDSLPPAVTDIGSKEYYADFLPLELYFENDEPGRRSYASTTNSNYESLYTAYVAAMPEYRTVFSAGLTGSARDSAIKKVDLFFENTVTASYKRLNEFAEKIQKALESGYSIELEVRGRTSPLAKSEYNELLSRRRIASLVNFFKIYNGGKLAGYLLNKKLIVTEVAAGESLAGSGISDVLRDKRNSVYNPDAAKERKIEVINIQLIGPQE